MPIWTWLFLLVALVALAPVAAPLLAATHPLAALLLRDFFSRLCHQNPARSFAVQGSPVAVCVRCLGIYMGAAVGMCWRWGRERTGNSAAIPWPAAQWLAVTLLLNGLDVAAESLGWHGNWPVSRFVLGLLLGAAAGVVLTALPDRQRGLR